MKTSLNATPISSYKGQQVYIGIDVHKRRYVVVVQINQTVVKKWSTAAVPEELAQQLLRFFLKPLSPVPTKPDFLGICCTVC